jgi:hypothetical protein
MIYDVVFTCNSINNKNVRGNELKILRKIEEELCFEFGETENNVKRRFYKDLETLNKDFEQVEKIKVDLEKEIPDEVVEAVISIEEPKKEIFKKPKNKNGKKKIF